MNKLSESIVKDILVEQNVKQVVGVYPGRFQPMGLHHFATYKWLKSQFDDAYIATSDVKQLPKSPMNFKEKVRHMAKVGVPTNKISLEKNVYAPKNLTKKFDPKKTALVFIFGAKDAGRLTSGKYFKDYKKNRGNLEGFDKHGYILTAPHQSVKVDGKELSGTQIRQFLGHPDYTENRENLFKKLFGYFDKGVFQMMVNKFSKIFESVIMEQKKVFKSSGIIPYIKEGDTIKYLILKAGQWDFPKGGIEDGEDILKTAKRETKEETGLSINKIYRGYKETIKYFVRKDYTTGEKLDKPAPKFVTFFLGEAPSKNVTLSFEHDSYKWVTYEEGLKLLKQPNAKSLLTKAHNVLKNQLPEEVIKEFFEKNNVEKIIKESSGAFNALIDDGPPIFHKTFSDYKRESPKYVDVGWQVLDYMLAPGAEDPELDYTLSYNIVPVVAYGRSGDGEGYPNPIQKYKERLNIVLGTLGWEVIKWMGVKGKETTGVDVEAPEQYLRDKSLEKSRNISFNIDLNEEVQMLLSEGGAAGHMNHPFDDKNLKFKDFKNIIEFGLGGKLSREDNVTEKLDGQNIMISWKDGKLISARNKGHIKNGGKNALDISGVTSKFSGRGDIRDAFVYAMKDLNKAISSLTEKQREKIFKNGYSFMNLEVMWPASANVIDYDVATLVFHGAVEYDENGNAIGQVPGSAKMLEGMIRQINQNVQKHYKIGKPNFLEVPKHQDYGKRKKYYFSKLQKLQDEYNLKDNDTLAKYHEEFWRHFIYENAKKLKYKITRRVISLLIMRWAFDDRSYSIVKLKRDIKSEAFRNWVDSFDKNDHTAKVKETMKPFELLFFELGVDILKNVQGYIAIHPDKAIQRMRADLNKAIQKIQGSSDIKKINTLKLQLQKLNAIGGVESILPTEGIVFKYNGNLYKFTGSFAALNQILGLVTF